MHNEHECVNSEIGDGGEEFMWQKAQILKNQFLTQVVPKPGELTIICLGISCIGGFSTCFSFLMINFVNSQEDEWVAYPFYRGSSQPRNRTGVSCFAGGFFTS